VLTHIRKFREDPQKWRTAMGPEIESTRQWESSIQKLGHSYKVAVLLGINVLLKDGIFKLGDDAVTDDAGFIDIDADDSKDRAVDITARLAEYLEVVKSRPNPLSRVGKKRWVELGDRIIGAIFTDGSNPYYEYGFDMKDDGSGAWNSQVRDLESGRVITTTPEGQLSVEQHNHFAKALTAINAAILDDHSWIIGKCVRGGEKGRTIDIVLGVCKP
jgi:hypothetical protein